jgi:hypothetical protein
MGISGYIQPPILKNRKGNKTFLGFRFRAEIVFLKNSSGAPRLVVRHC